LTNLFQAVTCALAGLKAGIASGGLTLGGGRRAQALQDSFERLCPGGSAHHNPAA